MISMKKFYHEWQCKSLKDRFFMTMGAFFLFAAVVGLATPVIPQVPFAIIAAFFFSRGSPKIHHLIRKNPLVGQAVCDWEDHRKIGTKMKTISTVSMIAGACAGHWFLQPFFAFIMDAVFAVTIVFVLTRRSETNYYSGLRENT